MLNIELWNKKRKEQKITLDILSEKSGIALSTIKEIFRGKTLTPRIDTVQAIERALGLAPTFTEEERALGLSENHLIAMSDDDRELFHLFAEAEEKLGKEYVRGVKQMVRVTIDTKGKT